MMMMMMMMMIMMIMRMMMMMMHARMQKWAYDINQFWSWLHVISTPTLLQLYMEKMFGQKMLMIEAA